MTISGYVIRHKPSGMYLRFSASKGIVLSKNAPRFYATETNARRAQGNIYNRGLTIYCDNEIIKATINVEEL